MSDSIRPQLSILEANSLITVLREVKKFGGLLDIGESHIETAEKLADRLDMMLAYWQARETVKRMRSS